MLSHLPSKIRSKAEIVWKAEGKIHRDKYTYVEPETMLALLPRYTEAGATMPLVVFHSDKEKKQ